MRDYTWLLLTALLLAAPTPSPAQDTEQKPELGIQEHLGRILPLDEPLEDEAGNAVTLRQIITKPTILTFVYYRCPGICTPLLTELSRMVDKMDIVPGRDYQIVSLSFDHREPPSLGAGKKESYLGMLKRPIDPAGWRFLTADSLAIQRVTDAAGFYFKREGNDFVHAAALIIVSPEGKITRYINGVDYLPFDIKMALLEAADGKTTPTIAKILKFCFAYDPEARTYALNVTRIGALVVLALVAVFVLVFVRRPKRKVIEKEVRYGQS